MESKEVMESEEGKEKVESKEGEKTMGVGVWSCSQKRSHAHAKDQDR